jgi:iron(III) transport system substrate-binding protein
MPSTLTARLTLAAVLAAGLSAPALAAGEVNVYSSRHYDTDAQLFGDFTAATGITVNLIEANADELIARIQAEGANSPADVLITVDAGRLWRAVDAELLQPVDSAILRERIPAHLRHPSDLWFAFSQRARVFFHDKASVPTPPQTYEELAEPQWKGKICMRSAGNIYSLSLMASMIAHHGEEKAKAWGAGLLANLARAPQGGDTDQLKAVASGECPVAISNTYYFARALRTQVDGLSEHADKIGLTFPNQGDRGTHMNVSGGALIKSSPNRENAVKFLEYLASDSAQAYFSAGNDEFPVVEGAALSPSVQKLGVTSLASFKQDQLNLSKLGENQAAAARIYDAIGFK